MNAYTGIDVPKVSSWLDANVDGVTGPYRFEMIVGGRSNLTFALTDASGVRLVVRRPPTGMVLATAHDMEQEHRIVTAVGQTGVPVPRTLGLCRDEAITGAPFYVMSFVDGVVLDGQDAAAVLAPETRRALGEHLVDVLADLHAVDVDAVGLGDLARRDGYVERQVRRWTAQWETSRTRDLPAVDELGARLARRIPRQQGVAIAHGDYRFGNCLVDTAAGRVTGVLDWELCTLGDPLADLGYLGVYWTDPGDEQLRTNDPTGLVGFPTFAELVDRYARQTGRDLDRIDYYVAFSSFRLAVIAEGVYARFLHGAMGDQQLDDSALTELRDAVETLSERALSMLPG